MLLYCKSVILKCYECLPEILKRSNSIINLYVSSVRNFTINCYYGTNKIKEKSIYVGTMIVTKSPMMHNRWWKKYLWQNHVIKTSFIKYYNEKRPNAMLNDNKK